MSSHRISILLQWCAHNSIIIDKRLAVIEQDSDDGESLCVIAADYIPSPTPIVKIPKTSVLSLKTCHFAASICPVVVAHRAEWDEPNVWLSLALMTEIALGGDSQWFGYIQSLPKNVVDLAIFWESDGGEDGQQARSWSRGTEIEKLLLQDHIEESLRGFFHKVVSPLVIHLSLVSSTTYASFRHAYSLVSSRAFHVDAYHGIAMVPIADAFNHTEENHVHFESDYQVCPTCGSFDECPHDEGNQRPTPTNADDDDDTCEIVSNISIYEEDEVFNTYDSKLSNAQLLCHYGFLLEGNSNDTVTWPKTDSNDDLGAIAKLISGLLPASLACDRTEEEDEDDLKRMAETKNKDSSPAFAINAEGVLSTHLLASLLLKRTSDRAVYPDICGLIARIYEEEEDNDPSTYGADTVTEDLILGLCEDVDSLCATKIAGIGPLEAAGADWGAILDTSPRRARLAITQAMAERSILESCRDTWVGIAALLIGRRQDAEP